MSVFIAAPESAASPSQVNRIVHSARLIVLLLSVLSATVFAQPQVTIRMPKAKRNADTVGVVKTVIVDGEPRNQRGQLPSEQLDSDNDGVADIDDRCPASIPPVDLCGCTKPLSTCCVDSDRDGVADCYDRCPNTMPGLDVDARGCIPPELLPRRVFLDLKFPLNGHELLPGHAAALGPLIAQLQDQPALALKLEGHTDATGTPTYNLRLSRRRADTVAAYIIEHGGISANRISVVAYGESRPVVKDANPEMWWPNRRVNGLLYIP